MYMFIFDVRVSVRR